MGIGGILLVFLIIGLILLVSPDNRTSNQRGCTEVVLVASPVTVNDPHAPVTFTATMTADGRPVAGAELIYFIEPETPSGEQGVGGGTGKAKTDTNGIARFVRDAGIDGLAFGNDRLTEYIVQYSSPARIGGIHYCQADTTASIIVQSE